MKNIPVLLLFSFGAAFAASAQEQPKFSIGQCYAAMWGDPKAALVLERAGIGKDPIPLSLRASKAKATAKEKESLEFVAKAMQACQQQDKVNRAEYHPLLIQVIDEFESSLRSALVKTYAGDLTWGGMIEANEAANAAFNRKVEELRQADVAEQERKKAAQAAQQAQAEEQRKAALRAEFERQQRLEQLQRMAEEDRRRQSQQEFMNGLMLLQQAQPRPMAPMFAPSVNCQSRNVGGTTYTDCR